MRKVVLIILAVISLFLLVYWGGLYWTYSWLTREVHDLLGLESGLSRLVAIAVLALSSAVPWSAILFPFVRAKRRLLACVILTVVVSMLASVFAYLRRTVNFGPDEKPRKTLVVLPSGPAVRDTSEPGIDPVTGRQRELLTPERLRQLELFKKHADESPAPGPGQHNFNRFTGESESWLLMTPTGCVSRHTPGYDDETGRRFLEATPDLIEECKTRIARTERQQSEDAERKQQAEEEKMRRARQNLFEEPGIYAGPSKFWTLQGLRFSITEAYVFANHVVVPVQVSNPSEDYQEGESFTLPVFTIVREDGSEAPCSVTKEDGAAQIDMPRAITPPAAASRSTLSLNCARDTASGHFALAINHQPVFRITRYAWRFRPF
jgi:hypothetical protein